MKRRSECPLNASIEILGDHWSLLIVRDMMLRGFKSYKDFMDSYERIATNILADRLRKLEFHGIIEAEPDPLDERKTNYVLTRKGIELGPVMTEMVLWAGSHERVENQALIAQMRRDKTKFNTEIRARWEQQRSERESQREFAKSVSGRPTRTSDTPLPLSVARQAQKI
ncbi:MAG: helix-turn-helix transcriptional regulator [Acidobacteria bacterium]|nr:helix-turn-helix transcriptional regulator [Acidobacteriota bacterium]